MPVIEDHVSGLATASACLHALDAGRYHRERNDAFLRLLSTIEAGLRGFIRNRIGAAPLAVDDVLQRTYLKAWAHAEFDPARGDAPSFLFTIAANVVTDWLRSDESKSVSLDELTARPSLVPSMVDRRARDPLARMMAEESATDLRAALAQLSADHREVLERFYLRQEGTQFEIAEAMGLSVAAFNSRLNRARLELKRILEGRRADIGLDQARTAINRVRRYF